MRRFTPTAAKKANLLPHDIGRKIGELSHPLLVMAANAAQQILNGVPKVESFTSIGDAENLLMRASPFTQNDGSRSGATVSFLYFGPLKPDWLGSYRELHNDRLARPRVTGALASSKLTSRRLGRTS
ncbi:MAG: PAS domain-containing protein [Verrucomicrobia bacterium]|nr:PAS domain-containing protein [Verrucomicrobiota bacterium]